MSEQRSAGRVRRFRNWLTRAADRPYALPLMMLLSFADACISPILPEVVLVPMCLGRPERRYRYAMWASIASVMGGLLGYLIGYSLWEAGMREFFFEHVPGFSPAEFEEMSSWFGHSAFLVTFLAGFTPLPYKVFTVAAGVCHSHVDVGTFLAASLLSRSMRFYLEIWLLHRFGPPFLEFLFRRLGLVLVLASFLILAIVFYLTA